ncbi:MAG: dephospho-CoA kinase [Planctomycetes bacterium]|nr:dephospho-CoA kinase [Planctomycetota bacterium]MCH8120606.1 dephospho-CoA kinase [Planctomycetota bacterium]
MGNIGEKPVIGILGGIGSGKSTVAAEFAKLGCKVIDADEIAHELLDEPTVKEKVVGLFGRAILDSTGKIDREKLAELVFTDAGNQKSESALCLLSSVLHPLVLQRAEELIEQYNRQNQVKAIVLDMPLLVEVGWDKRCDKLIFVDCEQKLRLDRAKKMGFDKNQVKIRENFQISLDKKANVVDNTIENNSDFSALAQQVAKIFSYIVYNG